MQEQQSILVVDDERGLCDVMARLFSSHGYDCRTADSGRQAISIIEKLQPQVVLSDITMPDMNGLEVTRNVLRASPGTAVVLMTGNASLELAIEALRLGASDFLLKPFDFQTVERSVQEAISKKRSQSKMKEEVANLKHRLQEVLEENESISLAAMESFCKTLEMRDIETFSHVQRVSHYAFRLAQTMGLRAKEQEEVRCGALLHDIGKVAVPDRVLLKPGPLSPEEWVLMKKHVRAGYAIIGELPGLEVAAQIVLHHHERFDGEGYPQRLSGEEICLGARIFAVVDTYDAITTDRPYRKARSDAEARNEIRKYSGVQHDPKVVEAFLQIPVENLLPLNEVPGSATLSRANFPYPAACYTSAGR